MLPTRLLHCQRRNPKDNGGKDECFHIFQDTIAEIKMTIKIILTFLTSFNYKFNVLLLNRLRNVKYPKFMK